MRIAVLTTDGRELLKDFGAPKPCFGTAPEALLQGFAKLPELEVHVISCVREEMNAPAKLADNIYFHQLRVSKAGWIRTGYQGCIRAVRARLKQIQPDIVHGQGSERECAMCAVFSGYPNVVTIHGNMAALARLFNARMRSYDWLAGKLENFALRRTAGVFCNSLYTEELVRPRARKTWRVPNAVREEFLSAPAVAARAEQCVLLNVGQPGPRKRQLELLDMVPRLRDAGLKCQFRFVGDIRPNSEYGKKLLERIAALEGEGYARCDGPKAINELLKSYDEASALVHFPTEEAFGLVVVEALCRGLKLFGSRVGGIAEIADGVPGAELFDAGDFAGLSAGIARWVKMKGPRPAGTADIMRARYSPQLIARTHEGIYREVLAESGVRREQSF